MKKRIAYTGYIIIVTVFFLYYLFPCVAVTSYINYQINSMSPGVKLSIKELKPSFPPGMKFFTLDLMHRNKNIIGADFLKISPSYFSLFSKDKTFFINGDIYEGCLNSTIQVADISANPAFDLDASFGGVQISQIPAINEFEAYQISGVATGDIVYSNREIKGGKGNAGITVTDSTIQFTPALFGIDQLAFKAINADFEVINQRMTLKKLDVDSREVSAHASGSIILRNPINKSTINIRGELKPHPTFIKQLDNIFPVELISRQKSKTGGIPFRITGSLERPNFSLR
ncbi:MAG: type II secretion system protein GspN [Desulfobacteraceae bacterium]|nr:type II secretion system protein GspN [Desulfobacteraceae bacterium]MBC2755767.1 type II secretion system protein GspN [Desulfobacteraceae bacterium]